MDTSVLDWLLEGDPAIRWQVERDLLDLPRATWSRTRELVGEEGWGASLVARQDDAGTWGDGLYTPKWTSTTYTLLLLRRLGLDPANGAARAGCEQLLESARWVDGGVTYWDTHAQPEFCVNAMVLSVCGYFGIDDQRTRSILEMLVGSRTPDGAWNCRSPRGDVHGSFHTTISVLEALEICGERGLGTDVEPVMDGAHEFLLSHSLFRSHRTGEVINDRWLEPHFPPRYHYDVLRGLEHLANVAHVRDRRCAEGIGLIASHRRVDGRWPKGPEYGGHTHFRLEPGRVAGRWNTLRALRVLRWWEAE